MNELKTKGLTNGKVGRWMRRWGGGGVRRGGEVDEEGGEGRRGGGGGGGKDSGAELCQAFQEVQKT